MRSRIVAFFGEAGSGKDTLANELVSNFDFKKHFFAEDLKKLLSDYYAIPLRYFNDRNLKDAPFDVPVFHSDLVHQELEKFYNRFNYQSTKFPDFAEVKFTSPRHVMQYVGTEIFRNSNESIWNDSLHAKIESIPRVVISDGRFKEERDFLRRLGATLIRVNRQSTKKDEHKSENDFGSDDEYDIIIYNDGTLIEFINNFNLWFLFIGSRK